MRAVMVALMLAGLAGPALAQVSIPTGPTNKPLTSEEIEKRKAVDQAYQEAIKSIPDQKGNADPWASVRSVEQPAGAKAKAAPPKTPPTRSASPKNTRPKAPQNQ